MMRTQGRRDRSRSGGRFPGVVFVCLLLGPGLVGAETLFAEEHGQRLEDTRNAFKELITVRRLISKEKRDWALGQELLGGRIESLERAITSMRDRIKKTQERISTADDKRADLTEERKRLESAATSLRRAVDELERRTARLLVRLPEPIRDRVKDLSQSLPEDPETTEQRLPNRFQNIVGILNAVNKFNAEITVTSEIRELGDGTTAEVTALYLGIGQGYYASADGKVGGVGYGSNEGWVWKRADESAEQIAGAIAILRDEEQARFVRLPIRIE